MLTDVAISGDSNVVKKGAEKFLKCEDLTIDIERVWSAKNKCDAINNNGSWNHLQLFGKHLNEIPGKREMKGIQKTAILGTAHMLRKVLM